MIWDDSAFRNFLRWRRVDRLTVVIAAVLAGCSGNTLSSMSAYPVKGKVVLADGKPLTSGRVVFVNPDKALEFDGPVGSDGSYTVKSDLGEGAPEGSYKVRIEIDAADKPQGIGTS